MKLVAFLIVLVASAVLDLLFAWGAMVLLGIAHGFDGRVPDLGYWTTFFVIWAFGFALSAHDAGKSLGEQVNS